MMMNILKVEKNNKGGFELCSQELKEFRNNTHKEEIIIITQMIYPGSLENQSYSSPSDQGDFAFNNDLIH